MRDSHVVLFTVGCNLVPDYAYLDRRIEERKVEIAAFPAEYRADWEPLNQLFLETLAYHTKPLSDCERINITADMILRRYKEAFMELAK